jgi:hypothetical protein
MKSSSSSSPHPPQVGALSPGSARLATPLGPTEHRFTTLVCLSMVYRPIVGFILLLLRPGPRNAKLKGATRQANQLTVLCSEAWGERSAGTFGGMFRAEVTFVTEWNTWVLEQGLGRPAPAPHTYTVRARAFGADDLHAQLAAGELFWPHVVTTDGVPIVPNSALFGREPALE